MCIGLQSKNPHQRGQNMQPADQPQLGSDLHPPASISLTEAPREHSLPTQKLLVLLHLGTDIRQS